MARRTEILAAALAALATAGAAQDVTLASAPIAFAALEAQAREACAGPVVFGPATITLAEIDGDGRTDLLFDWSRVSCSNGGPRGAGFCGMHMCSVDLYASSVYAPGGYPQGILALEFDVQPRGSDIILRTTSMGGSCPFAEVCEAGWRWTGAALEPVR